MKITWFGHASFRIDVGNQVLLLDPWLDGNPMFDAANRAAAIKGATHIFVTHGHGDHAAEAPGISKETGAPVVGIYDWVTWVAARDGLAGAIGMNKGGTVKLGNVAVTMVNATHSSSVAGEGGQPIYAGCESGYMIAHGGRTLYVAGDTDVMADMGVFAELHAPDYAILPIGGHFTMDARRAAYAVKKFFNFKAVLPSHYRTFPLLAQSADEFAGLIAPVRVESPEVMGTVVLA
ncbi:MAG TPA: metal-dependent hydrolase [Thermohalobaculum sp.]|nr:metal-dependent hydrolase [Thermohalobaculum sp.]